MDKKQILYSKKNKIHYAWFICAGCALLIFCTTGLAVNAFTIYQPYMIKDYGFTNTQASSLVMIRNIFGLFALLFVNRYYKILSLRTGMALSGFLAALSFTLYGATDRYFIFCLSSALMGIAYGFGSMVPISILINRWFYKNRDTAIGICSAVTGLATLGIPSATSHIIEKTSLSFAFILEGIIVFAIIAISWILLRDNPSDKGNLPYGEKNSKQTIQKKGNITKKKWIIIVPMLILTGAIMSTACAHLTVLATGEGYSGEVAAVGISVFGVSMMLSKIIYGRLADIYGCRRTNYLYGLVFISGLILCVISWKNVWLYYFAMALYGFGVASTALGLSVWPAEISSSNDLGRNVQMFHSIYTVGSIIFAPLPGFIADKNSGRYNYAFALFAFISAVVFCLVQIILKGVDNKCSLTENS